LGETALEEMTRVCAAIVISLTEAWDATVNGEHGLRAAFNQAFRNADKEYDEVANEARDVLRRIERLKTGQVEYPPAVELFLERLRKALPQAKARVLCDAVEVTKPEWQSPSIASAV
jgi:hypothetical protein